MVMFSTICRVFFVEIKKSLPGCESETHPYRLLVCSLIQQEKDILIYRRLGGSKKAGWKTSLKLGGLEN